MRINQTILINLAQETAEKKAKENRNILAAYLQGSLLSEDPFLGGTTDIDIVFIHNYLGEKSKREIIAVNQDIHFDIAHHEITEYRQPRQLRIHPWLGPTLFNAKVLYDPQHTLDFVQAGVRGLYHRADFTYQRALPQAQHARQIWLGLINGEGESHNERVKIYLKAIQHAANALALLVGTPLTERRFLQHLYARAQALGDLSLYAGTLELLGSPNTGPEQLRSWLAQWEDIFDKLKEKERPPTLHPHRKAYYLKAMESLLESERPMDTLWVLLNTLGRAIQHSQETHTQEVWGELLQHLGLDEEHFTDLLERFDSYLDKVETSLEKWGKDHGAL